jgi:hypothetical protein
VDAKTGETRRRHDSKYVVHDQRRFVYFVVQKVACSSVKTALLPLFDLRAAPFEKNWKDGTRAIRVHRLFDASDYQVDRSEMLGRLDGEYRNYFKFAFVRNPWDRLVSCYSNKFADRGKGLGGPQKREEAFPPSMTFTEFVEAVHATPDEEANPHFRSQHTVVCGPDGEPMADFVGRFENLREDFRTVAEKIGAPELELPHRLKSRHRGSRPYTDFYDERLKGLAHKRYEKDIETFGYSF